MSNRTNNKIIPQTDFKRCIKQHIKKEEQLFCDIQPIDFTILNLILRCAPTTKTERRVLEEALQDLPTGII